MISVTRINGDSVVVNAGLIEFVEATPDTLISLATGRKIMIRESIADVVERTVAYYQRIGRVITPPPDLAAHEAPEEEQQE
ncbi:MAG: flagellar FlbD family protein [Armatimonadota bacterium]